MAAFAGSTAVLVPSAGARNFCMRTERNIMNRRSVIIFAAGLLTSGFGLSGAAVAQTAKDLVGTWTMVSNVNTRADGSKIDVWGPHGKGIAIFESNGRFAIVNVNPDTPKFASNNRSTGTPDENKATVQGSLSLFGTYSVDGKVITYKIEGSSYPNWTGTEQKRNVTSFTGDELHYTLPGSIGGTSDNVWRRVK
jgi:uncharacterized protein (DUF2147 family)